MEQGGAHPIQWYPGHMAKARRRLAESLKLIDVVVELCDARAPASTRNPDFDDLFAGKTRVVLLNKSDLADPRETEKWIARFRREGALAEGVVSTGKSAGKTAAALITRAAKPKVDALMAKGVHKVVRCMVVGIPNVGKSTLINRVAGVNRAAEGDKPGVTRSNQWVRITPYLELMDTPGLLWPKLSNQIYAKRLAYIGSVNDDALDYETLSTELISELLTRCPDAIAARYGQVNGDTPAGELLAAVCRSRGFLLKGGEPDTERAARVTLDEFRGGKIARVTFDRAEEEP